MPNIFLYPGQAVNTNVKLSNPLVARSSGTAYSMEAAVGNYSLTGNAANVTAQRKVLAAVGNYTVTGNAANVASQRKMTAGVGNHTLTGNSANLTTQRKMAAAVGNYTVTGNAAGLRAGRKMTAGLGNYTLTGKAVTFKYSGGGVTVYIYVGSAGWYQPITTNNQVMISSGSGWRFQ